MITLTATIEYSNMRGLTLNAGPRHNIINVTGTSTGTTIYAGPQADAITVGPSLDQLGQVAQVGPNAFAAAGSLTVNARGGTLTLDDRGTQPSPTIRPLTCSRFITQLRSRSTPRKWTGPIQ